VQLPDLDARDGRNGYDGKEIHREEERTPRNLEVEILRVLPSSL